MPTITYILKVVGKKILKFIVWLIDGCEFVAWHAVIMWWLILCNGPRGKRWLPENVSWIILNFIILIWSILY